jgi:hypothetical protein
LATEGSGIGAVGRSAAEGSAKGAAGAGALVAEAVEKEPGAQRASASDRTGEAAATAGRLPTERSPAGMDEPRSRDTAPPAVTKGT